MTFESIKNYSEFIPSNKHKIGLLIGGKTQQYNPCSYIRILSPLNELANYHSFYIIDNDNHEKFFNDLNNDRIKIDILIIQRDIFDSSKTFNLNLIKLIFEKLKGHHVKIVFDIDDDLLNIDETHPSYEKYTKLKTTLKYIIINSDIITVPNILLKNQLLKYNNNIIIIQNTLMRFWSFNSKQRIKNLNTNKTIKIGYFGSSTHGEDIKIIEESIIHAKNHLNKKLIFEVIGICEENYDWMKRINVPRYYNTQKNYNTFTKFINYFLNKLQIFQRPLPYQIFIQWIKNTTEWDIAVAPLEDTNINRSKSNLKYLEYTALNIPGIYSNIGPYKEIGEKNTGIVVNNTTEEWTNALITLIEDYELYATILKNAHKDVSKNYLVKNSVEIWEKIIKEII